MFGRRGALSWGVALFLCASSVAMAEEELSSREVQSLTCPRTRCGADWNCEGVCSEAASAVCGPDGYCQFTPPDTGPGGGGGGPGGPGNVCGPMRCGGDWNCVCEGVQGTCGSNFYCQF